MLKTSAIKRLTNNNIANSLVPFFESHSFKFVKGKHSFIKTFDEEITQIVEISNVEWGFHDDTNNHYLFFELKYGLEATLYSKWYLKQIGEEFLKHRVKTIPIQKIQCYLTLDLMEIPVDDVNVYGLTAPSQRFKQFMALSLVGSKYPEKESIISVEEFNTQIAQIALNSFNESSNLQFIFEQHSHELVLDFLHIQAYLGNNEIVKPYYQKCYDKSLPNIKEQLKIKSQYLKESLDWFKEFILTVERLTGIKFENPFESYGTIKRVSSRNQQVQITDNIAFEEIFRFDVSEVKIKEYSVNDAGDLLFCYDEDKMLRINSEGESSNVFTLQFIPEDKKNGIIPLEILNVGSSDEYDFDITAFSPDETYLVAGTKFGKYIVWELPQCKRIELFPSEQSLKRMGCKIIEVEGQKIFENDYWKNRIQSIHFFDNGGFFVMILKGKAILVWNRKFENVNFIGGFFNVTIHNENFMSQVINSELIVYKRRT
jgi:hypothetical protein